MRWQRQMGQKRFCFIGSNRPQKMHAINASKKVCDGYEWNTVTSPINNKCAKYQLTSDNPAPSIFRNLITKTAILDSIQMNDDWSRGGGGLGDKVTRCNDELNLSGDTFDGWCFPTVRVEPLSIDCGPGNAMVSVNDGRLRLQMVIEFDSIAGRCYFQMCQ